MTNDAYDEPTDQWLENINDQFRRNDIPPMIRPWRAIEELNRITNRSVNIPSKAHDKIFKWFEENTQAGSQVIGPLFTGSFFFDASFWPVTVNIIYGQVRISLWDSLTTMPYNIKKSLATNNDEMSHFIATYAACHDFAYGIDDLLKDNPNSTFAKNLLLSAYKHLSGTVDIIHSPKPNAMAIHTARFAAEMIMKAFLAFKAGLDERGAIKIGHDLNRALTECLKINQSTDFQVIQNDLGYFPNVEERYDIKDIPLRKIWEAYGTAQEICATMVRSLTDRAIRADIKFNLL